MKGRPRFPLFAKMLLWLLLHLAVLAFAFVVFVGWQLRLGLDSLLSGASGERLKTLGSVVASEMRTSPREEWPGILEVHTAAYGVETVLVLDDGQRAVGKEIEIPGDVDLRLKEFGRRKRVDRPGRPGPPGAGGAAPLRHEDPPRRPRAGEPGAGPPGSRPRGVPEPRPVFLLRSEEGGYWAGIDLPLFRPRQDRPLHGMLLLRSSGPSASGLFFELKPWLLGGLAVLGLSLVLWAPFIFSITRYVTRLSRATERIAEGRFEVKVGGRRSDELGTLGHSIERMAGRLDRLLRGQKRFLGDVAHELCSPLARIRTGLGVLEHRLGPDDLQRLESIEEDVGELSDLVAEVLAFTRAETAPESVQLEDIGLRSLVEGMVERECAGHDVGIEVPPELRVRADRRLLGRALANILRNADRHGGPECRLSIHSRENGGRVSLAIEDSGPGVAEPEIEKLFEPFYRPDGARTREAGGAGLGLAIVRSAIEACSGSVEAGRSGLGGLVVRVDLPAANELLEVP